MLGLAPATFVLLPFLLVSLVGMVMADLAGGAVHWITIVLAGWLLAGMLGIAALWAIVLHDAPAPLGRRARLLLTIGLLLGMAAAVRWLWMMGTSRHSNGAATWAVWLVLLGGPFVVASFRLVQLWGSRAEV